MIHKLKGHKKLVRAQQVKNKYEAIIAGWSVVKDATPYEKIEPVLGPRMYIDMWRWVDKNGSFVF